MFSLGSPNLNGGLSTIGVMNRTGEHTSEVTDSLAPQTAAASPLSESNFREVTQKPAWVSFYACQESSRTLSIIAAAVVEGWRDGDRDYCGKGAYEEHIYG